MKTKKAYYYEKEIADIAASMHREFADRINSILLGGSLTISQLVILELLSIRKSSNMSEFSRSLKLTMSAATSIIDKMRELRLVTRRHSEHDRRIVVVTLTKRGRSLAAKISRDRLTIIKEIFSVLSEEEKHLYLTLIKKIYNGLKSSK